MLCFLTNVRKLTDLFLNIHSKCEDLGLVFNPPKLRLDYEAASVGVANELYPVCQISGCNFHFNQCLWRTVQIVGLSVQYTRKDSVVRKRVFNGCIGTPPSS